MCRQSSSSSRSDWYPDAPFPIAVHSPPVFSRCLSPLAEPPFSQGQSSLRNWRPLYINCTGVLSVPLVASVLCVCGVWHAFRRAYQRISEYQNPWSDCTPPVPPWLCTTNACSQPGSSHAAPAQADCVQPRAASPLFHRAAGRWPSRHQVAVGWEGTRFYCISLPLASTRAAISGSTQRDEG